MTTSASNRIAMTIIAKNPQPLIRWIFVAVALSIVTSALFAGNVESASIGSVSSNILIENIFESNLENKCDINQERKDLCERCIRFVYDRSATYLGCCTNYDGIFDFCEKFLNYSFDSREPTAFISKRVQDKNNHKNNKK